MLLFTLTLVLLTPVLEPVYSAATLSLLSVGTAVYSNATAISRSLGLSVTLVLANESDGYGLAVVAVALVVLECGLTPVLERY
jgi:hypothetical protein